MPAPAKKAFALRLDPALYAALERVAAGDLRSVNAQVEVLLREALARRGVKVEVSTPPRRGRPPQTPEPDQPDHPHEHGD
ncbi:toxin-antitoxin system HicB family antitoxin [Novosphingobium sp. 1949]|uniref:Toxin-antitoxin system HicB family antitoxin n=1 Tax=Novosphingobium organovorum TaxID=2930092 RepID=A0ABT0BH76_9SPHN|nr:toxin-antitoxin system HicB family antitoxin [Novosphingobium organovorum]MCJ2184079.1 toxin-antitoxin system HicB family antitoxin [Novosphingobium organovorum]